GSDVIHITDYVAEKGSQKHIAYAASKAALHNMTLSFAAKFAPEVKVNSIAPAMILFNAGDDAAYQQKTLAKALLPKEAGNEEIIDLVEYLLNSHYVTGRCHNVDGGRHLR
ncbi:MAG: SDR family oxidoreductase, partial [Shewanella sp.]|nr:SDR family oxidoreductase [Shewanella sp.]